MGALLWTIGVIIAPVGDPMDILFTGTQSLSDILGSAWLIVVSAIIQPLIFVWVVLAMILLIERQFLRKKIGNPAKDATKLFLPYVWISLLKTAITFLPFLLIAPGIVILLTEALGGDAPFLEGIGSILLLAGIVATICLVFAFLVRFAFVGYELTLHDHRGLKALKASNALVKGRFWSVFWRYIAPRMVFGAAAVVIQLALYFVLIVSLAAIPATGPAMFKISSVLLQINDVLVLVLLLPILTIADYKLFDSLRKTK